MDNFVHKMMKELGEMEYFPRLILEGCYDALVNRHGIAPPIEGKEATLKRCKEILRELEY